MPYQPAGVLNSYGLGNYAAGTVANNAWISYDPGFVSYQTIGTYTTAGATNAGAYVVTNVYTPIPYEPETPEAMAERLAQMAKWDEEQKVIKARARELLEATLNQEQREQLKKESFFDLETSSGRIYRIKPGHKVERLDPATRKATSLFCIHPHVSVPADDIAVSQKMWLETDEETFLKTANETKLAA